VVPAPVAPTSARVPCVVLCGVLLSFLSVRVHSRRRATNRRKAKQSKAKQSKAKHCKALQSKAKPTGRDCGEARHATRDAERRAEQSRAEQSGGQARRQGGGKKGRKGCTEQSLHPCPPPAHGCPTAPSTGSEPQAGTEQERTTGHGETSRAGDCGTSRQTQFWCTPRPSDHRIRAASCNAVSEFVADFCLTSDGLSLFASSSNNHGGPAIHSPRCNPTLRCR
jgi:hypothetical protein